MSTAKRALFLASCPQVAEGAEPGAADAAQHAEVALSQEKSMQRPGNSSTLNSLQNNTTASVLLDEALNEPLRVFIRHAADVFDELSQGCLHRWGRGECWKLCKAELST